MTALLSIKTNKMLRERYANPVKASLLISNEKFFTRQMKSMQIARTAIWSLNNMSTGWIRIEKKVDVKTVAGIRRRIKSQDAGDLSFF